jgi:phosphate starvation-inducible PhoH-like protein
MAKRPAAVPANLKSKQKYPQEIREQEKATFTLKSKMRAKNYSQEQYMESLRENTITLCNGPAGSGKTYIVTGIALEKLMNNEIDRIVITRPVVEAGENLGFLPGDLNEKLHPYLLPLLDAIEDHVGPFMAKKLMESGKIEIAPLAFMRGRTFNNAYVILDEAQNTTQEQMRMFLTRLGYNTVFCINGDNTQCDLTNIKPGGHGLQWATNKLRGNVPEIAVIEFSSKDIVRNVLISKILTYLDAPESRKAPPVGFEEIKVNGRNSPARLLEGSRVN